MSDRETSPTHTSEQTKDEIDHAQTPNSKEVYVKGKITHDDGELIGSVRTYNVAWNEQVATAYLSHELFGMIQESEEVDMSDVSVQDVEILEYEPDFDDGDE